MPPALLLGLCCALAACGGGGGDDLTDATPAALPVQVAIAPPAAATVPAPVATVAPAAPSVAAPSVASTAVNASCGLNATAGIQAEVLQRVNAVRASGAVCGTTTYAATPALNWNGLLLQAATAHSSDMAQNNYFSHTSLDGKTMVQRIQATGYRFSALGENIAAGQTTVQSVVSAWINSPGHCQNLMNPSYRDIAVACVRNDAASYRLYWTMELGRT